MKSAKKITAWLCAIIIILYNLIPAGVALASPPDMSVYGFTDLTKFPESYKTALTNMMNMFPLWTFEPIDTGLDWDAVVNAQLYGDRSLIHSSLPSMRDNSKGVHTPPNWYYASKEAVEYYLDPRNWLNERNIFQFEKLSFDEVDHTVAAVERFLNTSGSFMGSGKTPVVPGDTRTYAQLFVDIGRERKVSPFHLASRVHQEQGVAGTSPLISGTYTCTKDCPICPKDEPYANFEGFYNFFNIKASGTTNAEIYHRGLQHAMEQGWDTPAKAIDGGAKFISGNYIAVGQDTLYLQKFDLVGTPYTNQYMQNVSAPANEAINIRNMYETSGSLDSTFVFRIPIYRNMPAEPASSVFNDYNITLTPPAGYESEIVYLDGVPYPAVLQPNGSYVVTAPGVHSTTAIMYRYDASAVPVGMCVWTLAFGNGVYTATRRDRLNDLLTYHGFSIRITGNTGIRVKTGISIDARTDLLTSGIGGFVLNEYGTLVMDNARMSVQYPLVKGGSGVGQGISYGINSDGEHIDVAFEQVDGALPLHFGVNSAAAGAVQNAVCFSRVYCPHFK